MDYETSYTVMVSTDGFHWNEVFRGGTDDALDETQSYLLEGYMVKMEEN